MHLLWIISILGISLLHLQLINCNDLELHGILGNKNENTVGNKGVFNSNSGLNGNDLVSINISNSMLGTIFPGSGTANRAQSAEANFGETIIGETLSAGAGLTDRGSLKPGDSEVTQAVIPGLGSSHDGINTGQHRGHKQMKAYGQQYGHALAGLSNLGIIIPKSKGPYDEDFSRIGGVGGRKIHSKVDTDVDSMETTISGRQSTYVAWVCIKEWSNLRGGDIDFRQLLAAIPCRKFAAEINTCLEQ